MAKQEKPQSDKKQKKTPLPRNTLGTISDTLRDAKRILEERETKENTKTGPKSPKKQEAVQIPNEIKELSEDDLLFHADENNYAEYEIMNKQNTEEGLFFTVNTYKPQEDLGGGETVEEEISAQQLDALLKNKNLLISKMTDNFTDKEERVLRVRVLGNAERQIERKILALEKSEPVNKQEIERLQKNLAIIMALQNKFKGLPEEASTSIPSAKETIEVAKEGTQEFQGEKAIQKIAELFADPNFTFPPLATHGSEFRNRTVKKDPEYPDFKPKKATELREEYPTEYQLTPDTDAQIALELLQEAIGMTKKNTESEKGQNYFQSQLKKGKVPPQVVLVPKGGFVEGAINIDTGGKQGIVLEQRTYKNDVLSNTIWIDHHGTEKAMLTSATALMLKFVKEIPQLNFKHEAQEKQWEDVAHFVTNIDNMTFPTNAKFIQGDYARTLYGLYKDIPTADLIRELKNGGERKVYTEKELEEKGWIQASKAQQFKVDISMGKQPGKGGIEDIKKAMAEKRFAPATPELGTYIFENYQEYDKFKNKPKNPLGFIAVKASGIDSHITLQPGGGFFMSSLKDLAPVYERLITAIPEIKDQVILIRGTMIAYDPRRTEGAKSVTEREIMSALDLFKKMERPVVSQKPAQPARRPEKPTIAIKRHVPGKRREDNPIPVSVQRFLAETNINPAELRFHTLETKSALEHFDPKVKILSDEQRRFVEAVQKVATEMNIQPEPKETLGGFITRISKAA